MAMPGTDYKCCLGGLPWTYPQATVTGYHLSGWQERQADPQWRMPLHRR